MTTAINSRKTAPASRGYKQNGRMMAATQVTSPAKVEDPKRNGTPSYRPVVYKVRQFDLGE